MIEIFGKADQSFHAKRAAEETEAALKANDPSARAAHHELAFRHLTAARGAPIEKDDNKSPRTAASE